jgi:hypothetical protein
LDPPDERQINIGDVKLAWAAGLKAGFKAICQEPMPDRFLDLLKQLEDAESRK